MSEGELMKKYFRSLNEDYIKKNKDTIKDYEKNLIPNEQINYHLRHALLYTRVSTNMQVEEGFSLDAQDSQLTKYCDTHNIQIIGKFCDEGISGWTISKRPQLQALIKTLRPGYILICAALNRLSRNAKQLLEIYDVISNKQCEIILLDLQLDTSSPAGKMMLTMMSSFAEYERGMISERVTNTMGYLTENNLLKTKPPYGWKRDEFGELKEIETEQIVIELIKTIINKNPKININRLTATLNGKNVRNRKGKPFHNSTIFSIIKNNNIPYKFKNEIKEKIQEKNKKEEEPKSLIHNDINNIPLLNVNVNDNQQENLQSHPLPVQSMPTLQQLQMQQLQWQQMQLQMQQLQMQQPQNNTSINQQQPYPMFSMGYPMYYPYTSQENKQN